MNRQRDLLIFLFVIVVSATMAAVPGEARAAQDAQRAYRAAVDRAVNFLRTKGQTSDGAFSPQAGIGVTALVTTGILQHGYSPNDPLVAKSLKYLEGFVQSDGGIYQPDTFYKNYETSLCVLCFAEANRNGSYDKLLKGADRFLKGLQWDEGEGQEKSSNSYGGAGYGQHKRPDLSNTAFLVDALKATGNGADDEAIKKALVFISRCQNLESEHNTTKYASKNPDGGFYYTPADDGDSKAGETAEGGLRSYGSMTYAGLKSMIYAGVGPEDPRVKAAFRWVQKHYDVKTNPGMGSSGLYYYFHTFAKALDAIGENQIEGADGSRHDWRRELRQELLSRQQPDGSWVNAKASRWLEGDPNLVTGYVLLTLDYVRPKTDK